MSEQDLLAIVAHHLRGALALVSTSTAILEQLLARGQLDSAEALRQIQQISEATTRMEALVRKLLEAGRLDAGLIDARVEDHSLNDVLGEVARAVDVLATQRGQRVVIDAGEPLLVRCDRELTLQVLWNLLENAIKFSHEDTTIELRASRHDAHARVCIVDRGPGISADELQRVFERYFQVRPRARGGVGLGLYIARAFLEAQGGTIQASSLPGHGSEFWFELPLVTR